MTSVKLKLAGVAIIVACFYTYWTNERSVGTDDLEARIIQAWDVIIKEPHQKFRRIAIGINANVDLIVAGVPLLDALHLTPGKSQEHSVIRNLHELQETFNHFFSKGAAAERAFSNQEEYKMIVKEASALPNAEWYIGGNAALMGQKIASAFPECKVQLVGPVGPRLQKLLHPAIQVPEVSIADEDEIHMILEYHVGDTWGSSVAPVATRFITSFDESNGRASSLEAFFSSLEVFRPDLAVCTGLHLLEGQGPRVWYDRIPVLKAGLQALPDDLPVHMELASMANPEFVQLLLEQVVPHVSALGFNEQELMLVHDAGQTLEKTLPHLNSLGLNEQETSFASASLDGPHADVLEDGQPPIHKVTDVMLWLLKRFGQSEDNPTSRLTRVHFHSLTFHIIGTVTGRWSNIPAAVAAGTRIAGRQACDVLRLGTEKFDLAIPSRFRLSSSHEEMKFNASNPVITWEMEGGKYSFSFSPVLVCKRPLKTVGLGDAISAVGLLFSELKK